MAEYFEPGATKPLNYRVLDRNADAADADSGTLELRILEPDGTVNATIPAASIVRDSLGLYHYDWTAPEDATPGDTWGARWTGELDGDPLTPDTEDILIVPAGADVGAPLVTLASARARGINLPADDTAAQDIIDETVAWLTRRIGTLTGSRTERFYVGPTETQGRLGLRRYTDAITVTDGTAAVDADNVRLVDSSTIVRTYSAPGRWWNGPYVEVAYSPSDAVEVRRALYDLIALEVDGPSDLVSEDIGEYAYTRAVNGADMQRAAIVASLLPKRAQLLTLYAGRPLIGADPVINRAEREDAW